MSVRCERSTFPFRCGDAGLIGRNLMPYSISFSWKGVGEKFPATIGLDALNGKRKLFDREFEQTEASLLPFGD